jgi:hypothetical protein
VSIGFSIPSLIRTPISIEVRKEEGFCHSKSSKHSVSCCNSQARPGDLSLGRALTYPISNIYLSSRSNFILFAILSVSSEKVKNKYAPALLKESRGGSLGPRRFCPWLGSALPRSCPIKFYLLKYSIV